MFKYKRGINNIEQAENIDFCISNNLNTYICLNACFDTKRPYDGLYIRNNKIMVENIFEKIFLDKKVYNIGSYTTATEENNSTEYILNIDLKRFKIEYDINGFYYSKKVDFIQNEDILYLEYELNNKTNKKVKMSLLPLLTYRDLFSMKDESRLKFNARAIDCGYLFNLSVSDLQNLVIKFENAKYNKTTSYLSGIKHEYIDNNFEKKTYTEDLFIPGTYEIVIKPNETKKVKLFFADKDFEIKDYIDDTNIDTKSQRLIDITQNIKPEYVELKNLISSIDNMNINLRLINKLPYFNECDDNIDDLMDIVRSIEGQFVITGQIKEAKRTILKINKCIMNIEKSIISNKTNDIIRLKLWLIESINRVIQKDSKHDIEIFFDIVEHYIKLILNDIENSNSEYLDNIDIVALWFNALKIYQSMLDIKKQENIKIYELLESLKKYILDNFWYEQRRILKQNRNETESYATVDMIYTLSLSYQCVFDDIPFKILDTVFKELYTPYGLRKISKLSPNNDLLVYPKYMAHFVKANLRQNGVTLASQKIAYNLVKELIMDIDKYVNGGIKQIYSEKGINSYDNRYDLITNAEMIRLYDMLV